MEKSLSYLLERFGEKNLAEENLAKVLRKTTKEIWKGTPGEILERPHDNFRINHAMNLYREISVEILCKTSGRNFGKISRRNPGRNSCGNLRRIPEGTLIEFLVGTLL